MFDLLSKKTLVSRRIHAAVLSVALATGLAVAPAPAEAGASVFNAMEKSVGTLRSFTKWRGLLQNANAPSEGICQTGNSADCLWSDLVERAPADLMQRVTMVNDALNRVPYRSDAAVWGREDYWATPAEFIKRGGDCEDYAISKFFALRALGVSNDAMRIVAVRDTQRNIGHAVLLVVVDGRTYMLDNQIQDVLPADDVTRYKPLYSLNLTNAWLHWG